MKLPCQNHQLFQSLGACFDKRSNCLYCLKFQVCGLKKLTRNWSLYFERIRENFKKINTNVPATHINFIKKVCFTFQKQQISFIETPIDIDSTQRGWFLKSSPSQRFQVQHENIIFQRLFLSPINIHVIINQKTACIFPWT